MKKFFILASAAIVALASCAKTEVRYDNAEPQEIAFKQITDVMTKASDLATTVSLGVIAHYNTNGNLYFDNTQFTYEADPAAAWQADKYWPFEGNLDFTVYAPYGTAEYSSNVLTIDNVTAADGLYYGKQRYVNTSKIANVPVVLKHASAKITVKIKGSNLYTLTDLKLNGYNKTGNVKVTYGTSGNYDATAVETETGATPSDHQFLSSGSQGLTADPVAVGTECYVLPGAQTSFTLTFTQAAANPITFTKNINLSDNWVANHQYLYTINITADEIYLTATVEAWEPETPTSIDKTNTDLV